MSTRAWLAVLAAYTIGFWSGALVTQIRFAMLEIFHFTRPPMPPPY